MRKRPVDWILKGFNWGVIFVHGWLFGSGAGRWFNWVLFVVLLLSFAAFEITNRRFLYWRGRADQAKKTYDDVERIARGGDKWT